MTVLLQLRILFKFLFEIIWKIVIKCKKNVKGQKKTEGFEKVFCLRGFSNNIPRMLQSSHKDIILGSFIKYVRKIFRKTNISYPLIRTYVCVSGGKKC